MTIEGAVAALKLLRDDYLMEKNKVDELSMVNLRKHGGEASQTCEARRV